MYTVLWLVAVIVLTIAEFATVQLVSVWFVAGAIAALLAAIIGQGFAVQLVVFIIVSIISLFAFRSALLKKFTTGIHQTNADRVIGMEGIVLEEINNLQNSGRVSANGLDWTARTDNNDTIIPKDSRVVVKSIDGVKLIVSVE